MATGGKYQWDDGTGSDEEQDVHGETFNKHSWSGGKKTVSIHTELDDLNDPVAWRRLQSRTTQRNVAKLLEPAPCAVHGFTWIDLHAKATKSKRGVDGTQ